MSNQIAAAAVDEVDGKLTRCQDMLKKLSENSRSFTENTAEVRRQISARAEEMKQIIDNYKIQLLGAIEGAKERHDQALEIMRREVSERLLMIDDFKKNMLQMEDKEKTSDLAAAATTTDTTLEKSEVSLMIDMLDELDVESCKCELKFTPGSSTDRVKRILGDVTIEDSSAIAEARYTACQKPLHIIPGTGMSTTGVTSLGDEVFVTRYGTSDVTAYDATTFSVSRHMTIPNSCSHVAVAACPVNNCLYVSDIGTKSIYRVDMTGDNAVTNWSVNAPHGLAVTRNHNLLVACNGANKLQEFTTRGILVREIPLQSGISFPLNVVQLSGGLFGITHSGSLHRYCVVGSDGSVVGCYGNAPGSGNGKLNLPYGLAVNRRGTVFVGDLCNNRVLLLNPPSLTASQLSVDSRIHGPFALHIDERRGRLYVGEYSSLQRVLVLGQ